MKQNKKTSRLIMLICFFILGILLGFVISQDTIAEKTYDIANEFVLERCTLYSQFMGYNDTHTLNNMNDFEEYYEDVFYEDVK